MKKAIVLLEKIDPAKVAAIMWAPASSEDFAALQKVNDFEDKLLEKLGPVQLSVEFVNGFVIALIYMIENKEALL